MKIVFVEHQRIDSSYAVYVGGDDDTEGQCDRVFSYGFVDPYHVTQNEAQRDAFAYAKRVAKRIGGQVSGVVYT